MPGEQISIPISQTDLTKVPIDDLRNYLYRVGPTIASEPGRRPTALLTYYQNPGRRRSLEAYPQPMERVVNLVTQYNLLRRSEQAPSSRHQVTYYIEDDAVLGLGVLNWTLNQALIAQPPEQLTAFTLLQKTVANLGDCPLKEVYASSPELEQDTRLITDGLTINNGRGRPLKKSISIDGPSRPGLSHRSFSPTEQRLLSLYDNQAMTWLLEQIPPNTEIADLPPEVLRLIELYTNIERYRSQHAPLQEYESIDNLRARTVLSSLKGSLEPNGSLGKILEEEQRTLYSAWWYLNQIAVKALNTKTKLA